VGSLAVDVFSNAGFEVHAISGKAERASWLEQLGASRVLDRGALSDARPLSSVRFGGGLDTLGGPLLVSLLGQTASYGSVVSAGLAADASLPATVMPFILRGVSLLGVASASCPRPLRERVWRKLAGEYKPRHLDLIHGETVELEDLPRVFRALLDGQGQGRVLVRVAPEP
jgi:putative YhdH/YhfP family quinone oxidoreductase